MISSPWPKPCGGMWPCHQVRTVWPSSCCTCRFVAARPEASGWNQTRLPSPSKIIGPLGPGPLYGAVNRSPGVVPEDCVVASTTGAFSSGADWKCCHSPGSVGLAPRAAARPRELRVLVGDYEVEGERLGLGVHPVSLPRTVTVSPGANGLRRHEAGAVALRVAAQMPRMRAGLRAAHVDRAERARRLAQQADLRRGEAL